MCHCEWSSGNKHCYRSGNRLSSSTALPPSFGVCHFSSREHPFFVKIQCRNVGMLKSGETTDVKAASPNLVNSKRISYTLNSGIVYAENKYPGTVFHSFIHSPEHGYATRFKLNSISIKIYIKSHTGDTKAKRRTFDIPRCTSVDVGNR